VFGNLVFLAGQVADDKTGDIAKQTHEALTKVDDMLARAGTDKSRLLSMQIWLKTMDNFDSMNAVYDAWMSPGNARPAPAARSNSPIRAIASKSLRPLLADRSPVGHRLALVMRLAWTMKRIA
jgi:enamine deaminase RidA (YjgF/YER057c/UK114 family)